MASLDIDAAAPRAGTGRGVALGFFGFGALCVLGGMVWGIAMAASHDHTLSGAHAHLNLVGWATMGLMGLFYAVTPAAAASWLARIHLVLAAAGVLMLVPGIALAVTGRGEGLAILGSLVTLAAMLCFLWVLARHGIGRAAR